MHKSSHLDDVAFTNIGEATEKIVSVTHIDYKPMDVDEAVMQLDLIEDNFMVFSNARTEQVNVLYRKKDGNYGLIQPK